MEICVYIYHNLCMCIYSPKYIVYVCVYPKEDKFRFLLTLKI